MIGNSMTGIALATDRLVDGVHSKGFGRRGFNAGATPKVACKEIINNSFDAAILPLNSMLGMGIVFYR